MKLKKSVVAIGAIVALSTMVLAGCSPSTDSGSTSGAALTIAKPDGAITTESHNPFLGDSSASKYGYAKVIFEPLALVNPTGDLGTTPWLAESVEWNDDYTELTVVPRSGVKWSDGTPFTGEDIVFTFDMYLNGKLSDTSGLKYEGATVDGDAITLSFADSKYTAQSRVLHTPIVPKHIWENIADPNTDPLTGEGLAVGTGPYVLDNWSTESVTLTANEDYWGGELAVPELHYVSYGDNAALTTALVSGDADWAQAFIPQIQNSYLAADENNHFLVSPTAGAGTLFMNLQTKPFNNPALREALAWTIDREAYVEIAREGASEAVWNVTGLGTLLEGEILPEYKDENYAVDVDKAKQILTDAGYTWKDDALIDPDGEAVSFSISV
ncbi:MAG TPA: ABC transporter substrate-binding protein, partial [Protaetiibacter sp.]|nr:ABC transporter substrate-binding protein [Protaetiibacter sp.]